jgi:hypothetical protein
MASPLPQELQEITYGVAVASVDGASGTYFAAHTRSAPIKRWRPNLARGI